MWEQSWQRGAFSRWKRAHSSSAMFVGVLASVQIKGAESSLHFFSHHSSPIKQAYRAEAQRNVSPSRKMNVCSSGKWSSGTGFETVIRELLHADTATLEARAQEGAQLVLDCFTSDAELCFEWGQR